VNFVLFGILPLNYAHGDPSDAKRFQSAARRREVLRRQCQPCGYLVRLVPYEVS
jgi:hypothetical protein